MRLQLLLAVLIPEENRVRQARPQHALVARDNRGAAIAGFHVGDNDKPRAQLAMRILDREIFLVRPHRGHQHLGRQIHENSIDLAHQLGDALAVYPRQN